MVTLALDDASGNWFSPTTVEDHGSAVLGTEPAHSPTTFRGASYHVNGPDLPTNAITIRTATMDDGVWILPLSSRLHDFGPPSWRPREEMDAVVAADIEAALRAPKEGQVVLVAQDGNGEPLGFVHVHSAVDYFTHEVHSHVSDLAIARDAEGRGVGRALMIAAESWAAARGHRLLTLNVFDSNHRARRLYARLGYSADTTKLVKILRSSPTPESIPGSS
ncbi:MAG TPA: GNAT family N-acetyltransferase [Gemmatimonadaceae bacterium]